MKRLVFIILAILCLSSCGVGKLNPKFEHKLISGKVFQTLNEYEALVMTEDNDVVKIVTAKETLYDGKQIFGLYVMTGTYQYTTTRDVVKTVPVYVKRKELVNP